MGGSSDRLEDRPDSLREGCSAIPRLRRLKIVDFDFAGDVAGAPERLLGSRHDATALQGWKRNPIAESLPPP